MWLEQGLQQVWWAGVSWCYLREYERAEEGVGGRREAWALHWQGCKPYPSTISGLICL